MSAAYCNDRTRQCPFSTNGSREDPSRLPVALMSFCCRRRGNPSANSCCRGVSRILSGRCTQKWWPTPIGTTAQMRECRIEAGDWITSWCAGPPRSLCSAFVIWDNPPAIMLTRTFRPLSQMRLRVGHSTVPPCELQSRRTMIDCSAGAQVSESLASQVYDSYHLPDVTGSDHCPIGIVLRTES